MSRRRIVLSGIVLLAAVCLASAQERKGPGRGGFGGPGFGGSGFRGPGFGAPGFGGPGAMQVSCAMLLGMPEVQKELGLSDQQKKQIDDLLQGLREQMRPPMAGFDFEEMQKLSREEREKRFAEARKKAEDSGKQAEEKLGKVLDAKQRQRLGQLRIQREGLGALNRPDVAKQLGLTEDQQARIRKIQDDARPRGPGGFGGPDQSDEDRRAMFARMQKQREKVQADIVGVLTDGQKAKWAEMKGPEFKFPQSPGFGGFGPGGRGPGGFGFGGGAGDRQRPPLKKREP